MFEPDDLLLALTRARVDFIVIGGIAVSAIATAAASKAYSASS